MDRVEMLLAATLADRAEQAPVGPVRLDEPASRRRPITLAVLAASTAVVLIAVGVGALGGSGHRMTPVAPAAPASTETPVAQLPRMGALQPFGISATIAPADQPTAVTLSQALASVSQQNPQGARDMPARAVLATST